MVCPSTPLDPQPPGRSDLEREHVGLQEALSDPPLSITGGTNRERQIHDEKRYADGGRSNCACLAVGKRKATEERMLSRWRTQLVRLQVRFGEGGGLALQLGGMTSHKHGRLIACTVRYRDPELSRAHASHYDALRVEFVDSFCWPPMPHTLRLAVRLAVHDHVQKRRHTIFLPTREHREVERHS